MVSPANALALGLIVEGIETLAERDALVEIGARKGQGFLFDRPMDFASAYRLLEAGAVCAVPADATSHRFGQDVSARTPVPTTGSGPQ